MMPLKTISPFSATSRPQQEMVGVPVVESQIPTTGTVKPQEKLAEEPGNGVRTLLPENRTFAPASEASAPLGEAVRPSIEREPEKKSVHDPFWLGTRLVELGKLTDGQLETAIAMYRTHPRDGFASALERLSFCTQGQIARLVAERHGLEYIEIPRRGIAAAMVQRLKQVRATHHVVAPYKEEPGRITVAVADPTRYTALDGKRDFPNVAVKLVVAAKGDIL